MRRIGLGVTGLADMLIKMNLKYDSQKTIEFLDSIFKVLKVQSIAASVELAIERGAFPLWYDKQKQNGKEFQNYINHHYWNDIKGSAIYNDFLKYGCRNISFITYDFMLKGNYLNYLRVRNTLTRVIPSINIPYEEILAKQDKQNIEFRVMLEIPHRVKKAE
jgi:ribonucleotide reductase alpha subunit